ncbi:hypothetical protein HDU97_005963 [Phlyctochytrium planicorne]|nr:hypothetical protein HDU97_005963 [Phlyctochytrium planicorne]
MTESKTELLTWLNDLLQIKYNRVEQCGSGAAYCQVLDSIYGDVPISRVKFASKHEYDYINNLKILQTGFNNHNIEKVRRRQDCGQVNVLTLLKNIPIDKLVKCRFNDNLEFLQWMKKHWDAFYPGGGYDAAAKRAGRERARSTSVTKDRKRSASSTSVKSNGAGLADDHKSRNASPSRLRRDLSRPDSSKTRSHSNLPTPTTPLSSMHKRTRTESNHHPLPNASSYQSLPVQRSQYNSTAAQKAKATALMTDNSMASASAMQDDFDGRGRRTSSNMDFNNPVSSRPPSSRPIGANFDIKEESAGFDANRLLEDFIDDRPQKYVPIPQALPALPQDGISKSEHEAIVTGLNKKLSDLQIVSDTLERERNFYYLKLRDLEVVILERFQKAEPSLTPFLREIQTILYSTEEGFVSPKKRNGDSVPASRASSLFGKTVAQDTPAPPPVNRPSSSSSHGSVHSSVGITNSIHPVLEDAKTLPEATEETAPHAELNTSEEVTAALETSALVPEPSSSATDSEDSPQATPTTDSVTLPQEHSASPVPTTQAAHSGASTPHKSRHSRPMSATSSGSSAKSSKLKDSHAKTPTPPPQTTSARSTSGTPSGSRPGSVASNGSKQANRNRSTSSLSRKDGQETQSSGVVFPVAISREDVFSREILTDESVARDSSAEKEPLRKSASRPQSPPTLSTLSDRKSDSIALMDSETVSGSLPIIHSNVNENGSSSGSSSKENIDASQKDISSGKLASASSLSTITTLAGVLQGNENNAKFSAPNSRSASITKLASTESVKLPELPSSALIN